MNFTDEEIDQWESGKLGQSAEFAIPDEEATARLTEALHSE